MRSYVVQTINGLIQPTMKSETSLLISSALRLVIYNQCAHLSDLYRDVPGREMATEQPRVVVAHHRIRLELTILGTVLEMAPDVLTEATSLEDWLLIGVRLKFLATQLLANAESRPTAAKSDAISLIEFCRGRLGVLETHLRQYGQMHLPTARRSPQIDDPERNFREFVYLFLAEKDVDVEKKWRREASRVEGILTRPVAKKEDDPTASVDEDPMEWEARLRDKKKE